MKTSEQTDKISKAMAAAQHAIKNPPKNKINPHFNSKYVDLSDGLDTLREALSKQEIAIIQGTEMIDGFIFLNTRLTHSSGQWIESIYPVGNATDRPQALGSAMTYARRYSAFGMVGVAGEDDDDGNAAEEAAKASPRNPRPKPVAKQMEPGFSPTESESVCDEMMVSLEDIETREELVDWAAANSTRKERLLPEHKKKVTDAFVAIQKSLGKNG